MKKNVKLVFLILNYIKQTRVVDGYIYLFKAFAIQFSDP